MQHRKRCLVSIPCSSLAVSGRKESCSVSQSRLYVPVLERLVTHMRGGPFRASTEFSICTHRMIICDHLPTKMLSENEPKHLVLKWSIFFSHAAVRGSRLLQLWPWLGAGLFGYHTNLPGPVELIASLLRVIAALQRKRITRRIEQEGILLIKLMLGYPGIWDKFKHWLGC